MPSSKKNSVVEAILRHRFPSETTLELLAGGLPARAPDSVTVATAKLQLHRDKLLALPEIELRALDQGRIAEIGAREKAEAVAKQTRQDTKAANKEAARFFNQPGADADFEYWSKAEYWTFEEALALLLGKAPTVVTAAAIKREKNSEFLLLSPQQPSESAFIRKYEKLHKLAERATAMKARQLKPAEVLLWAHKTGAVDLPQPLVRHVLARSPKETVPAPLATPATQETLAEKVVEPLAAADPFSLKKWTPERLAELQAYRTANGTKDAAQHFGISATRVRELLPKPRPKLAGHSVFNKLKP